MWIETSYDCGKILTQHENTVESNSCPDHLKTAYILWPQRDDIIIITSFGRRDE